MITQNSIEQLLNVVNIEDVVGDFVSLKRSGPRYKGCCPFHDEKTPSFVVSPSIGIYKCFGCQKGGNAIQFMMDIDNLNFVEAAKSLAKRFGVELEETHVENQDAHQEAQRQRESIQAAVDFAQGFFVTQLFDGDEGKSIGLPYFKERGFTVETIKKWGLGYSPESWEALAGHSKAKGFNAEVMVLAGLLKLRDNGTHYDLFRHRVMFSIYSVTGKVIAFAGRKMSSTDPSPKYVNSPETELFKKSRTVFNIDRARMTRKDADPFVLVEGQLDAIRCHSAGIPGAIAAQGTAVTEEHMQQLRRFTQRLIVFLDSDAAGQKAALRLLPIGLREGLDIRFLSLPGGKDPDEYFSTQSAEGWAGLVAGARSAMQFCVQSLVPEGSVNLPLTSRLSVKAFNHALGTSPMTFYAAPGLRARLSGPFPACLNDAPMLVQGAGTPVRQQFDAWLARDLAVEETRAKMNAFAQQVFYPGDRPLREGERLRQPDLANTLEQFALEGADAIYGGRVAEAVVAELAA